MSRAGGGNPLIGVPVVTVLVGVLIPFICLDGQREYLELVIKSPRLVLATLAAWGVLLYWLTRRLAALFLLRGEGAKLRVRSR